MPPQNNVAAAAFAMMLTVLGVAMMDAAAKVLSASVPLPMVVWARFFFHSLWMLPVVLWVARRDCGAHFRRGDIPGHVFRGGLIALSSFLFWGAIRDNPIPDSLAVFFVEPIFVMFLAAGFLGEKLHLRRIIAAAAAFAGVLVVLRPGGGHYEATIIFALLAGFSFAAYIVATRKFALRGGAVINAWGAATAAAAWSAPAAILYWRAPDGEWWLLILLGGLAAGGHYMFAVACRLADASLVGIFHYSEIIAAAAISYVLFAHIPDGGVWAGFALIAGAQIVLFLSERRGKFNRH